MSKQFLSNKTEITFLDRLLECIDNCDEFFFSVSFIKSRGLSLIQDALERKLASGAKGRLLTTTYKNFTDLNSLNLFLKWQEKYPNFQCRIDYHSIDDAGFHSKGYIFLNGGKYQFLIGSTNITYYALKKNVEWNVALDLRSDDAAILLANKEFEDLWRQCKTLDESVIKAYKEEIEVSVNQWDFDENDFDLYTKGAVSPNPMQIKALREIHRYRSLGAERCLVVAATGSGKTYLAAFDARRFNAQKLLFVVHRDTILLEAQKAFSNVFRSRRSYGIFNGEFKETSADFIFTTNVTMAAHLEEFSKDHFDYIVFDECHHITGSTYQSILNYFAPQFTLGLTATPERLDEQDVTRYFGNNVPYELRLRDAITNSLVVPFHYFGVRDDAVDYSLRADRSRALSLASETREHFDFIAAEVEKHAPKKEKLKALAFCRNKEHAKLMADAFTQRGYPATTLLGEDGVATRVQTYSKLQDDDSDLQVICAVDILNEGIDIPAVNMVIFLRPTDSQTIFIQQLGRGLRKSKDKEFLTVLDFIGNDYDRAFHVIRALGEFSRAVPMRKRDLREIVIRNFNTELIPGVTVHFDEKSIAEVLKSIEGQNFNRSVFVKRDYLNFKEYLGLHGKTDYPSHIDYLRSDAAPDLIRFMRRNGGTVSGSYYRFLQDIDQEVPFFQEDEIEFIGRLSGFVPLVRREDFAVLRAIMAHPLSQKEIVSKFPSVTTETIGFILETLLKKKVIKPVGDEYATVVTVKADTDLFVYVNDLIDYGLQRFDMEFGSFEGMFKTYAEYDKEKILEIIKGVPQNFELGTMHDVDNHVTYLFVNIRKDALSISGSLAYKDRFLSPSVFQWESVNNTTKDNAEGKKLLSSKKVHLFLRRAKNEDGITQPFVYAGQGVFRNCRISSNDGKPTLIFEVALDQPIEKDYYFEFDIPEDAKAKA